LRQGAQARVRLRTVSVCFPAVSCEYRAAGSGRKMTLPRSEHFALCAARGFSGRFRIGAPLNVCT